MFLVAGCSMSTNVVMGRCVKMGDESYAILLDNEPTIMLPQWAKEGVFDALNTGDLIEITCGETLLSYPAQVKVFKVKVIEEGTMDTISNVTLENLREIGFTIIP